MKTHEEQGVSSNMQKITRLREMMIESGITVKGISEANCWVPEEYIPMRSYAYFQAYSFMKANWKPYLRQIGHAD